MITTIKIHNYKSIRELNLELTPITILIGANGAGKSNFIDFFKLLNQIADRNLQSYVAEKSGAENLLYFGRKFSEFIRGEILFEHARRYFFELRPNVQDEFFFEREGHQFKDAITSKWITEDFPAKSKEAFIGSYTREGAFTPTKKYLQGFRIFHFHDTGPHARIKSKSRIDDNSYLKEDGANLAAFLYFLQEKHPFHFKRIEKNVQAVAPFFDRFDLKPDRLNTGVIQLEWKEKEASDVYLNGHNFSDGTLRFIALATLLLQPELPQTILIDEPELGLHPFAISKLAGLLEKASTRSQLIISTQSVALLNYFRPEDIVTVDRKDKQSVFVRQTSQNLESWLQDYSLGELWEKSVIGGQP